MSNKIIMDVIFQECLLLSKVLREIADPGGGRDRMVR